MIPRDTDMQFAWLPITQIRPSSCPHHDRLWVDHYHALLLAYPALHLEPIEVRPRDDDSYEIENGHHRHLAAVAAGRNELACWIRNESPLPVIGDEITLLGTYNQQLQDTVQAVATVNTDLNDTVAEQAAIIARFHCTISASPL